MSLPPIGRGPDLPHGASGPKPPDGFGTGPKPDAAATAARQRELLLDLGQIGLDIAGLVDPTPISDGLNGIISAGRGDVLGAVISGASMVPYVGDLAKAGKLGRYARTIANAVELARTDAAFAKAAGPALEQIGKALDALPLDKLPGPLREPLQAIKKSLDELHAPPAGAAPTNAAAPVKGVDAPIVLSKARFGHTFTTHGQDATEFLTRRAKAMGEPNGQFLDDQAAARFILDNLDKAKNGAVSVPIPEGFPARIINPDGSYSAARTIRIVPGGKGVKTAYPEP